MFIFIFFFSLSPEVSLRVTSFYHLDASSVLAQRHCLLVQNRLHSSLTAFLLCNFITDDVILRLFAPVVWFDVIDKTCYIDVHPNLLKSNFHWSSVVFCSVSCF